MEEPSLYLLSVVIPTRDEMASVSSLLQQLAQALRGVEAEVIFVDDSDDDTPHLLQRLASEEGLEARVKHRNGEARRGGLSTAVVEGFLISRGQYVCVMDADLQHPPELVPSLLWRATESDADIVIASRYVPDGSWAGLKGSGRKLISWAAKWLVKVLFFERLHSISDPCSGFFVVRRRALQEVTLRPSGFKVLLEILVRCPWSGVQEYPLQFAPRIAGSSKAKLWQGTEFLAHVLRLFFEVRLSSLSRRLKRLHGSERGY